MIENKLELIYLDKKLAYANISQELINNIAVSKELFGPSHIRWEKEVNFTTPFEYTSSKSLSRIKKAKDFGLTSMHLKYELNEFLNKKDFDEWYKLYETNILNKDLGELKINSDWYEYKIHEITQYGSIIIRNENNIIIGGIIVSKKGQIMSCNFRAHEYIHIKDSSIAAILEYLIEEYALKFKFSLITRGADTNLYGVRLSKGLHEFKLTYGFKPKALDNTSIYSSRYLAFFKEYDEILTYIYDGENIILKIIKRDDMKKYIISINVINNF